MSVSDTSTIPSAAASSAPIVSSGTEGNAGVGSPCGSAPTVSTPSSARPKTPVTTVAPTTATRTAGIFFDDVRDEEEHRERPQTEGQGGRVGLIEPLRRTPRIRR